MSNNTTELNSNTALVKFTSDYEYVLGATTGRLLDIQGMFHSANFLDSQIEQIREDLESTAKMFAEQQGLAPGMVGWSTSEFEERINTGTLYNGIKAVRTGQTVHLRSEAQDKYGHYYGGHVEFGHQNVPARPHLRPALYAVSEASKGKLRSALYNLLTGAFNGSLPMTFGTGGGLSASYYRNGPGKVASYLTTGTRGQQMKYHFGSIRNNTGGKKGISRKASAFRQNMSNTAKKSMKWGKQKSLNSAQRNMYRRAHSSSANARRHSMAKQHENPTSRVNQHKQLSKQGIGYSQRSNILNTRKTSFPAQHYSGNNQYRANLAQQKKDNINRYYHLGKGSSTVARSQVARQSYYGRQAQKNADYQKLSQIFKRVDESRGKSKKS